MRIFDRFILFFFSLTFIVLAVFTLLIALGFYSQAFLNTFINSIYHDYDAKLTLISVSIIVILFGIYLFIRSMQSSKKDTTFSTNSTEVGYIKISIETLENIALNSALLVKGIKEPKVRVRIEEDESASFVVKVLVDGENSIPQISEEVQHSVKDTIERIAGISVNQVHIIVTNVSNSKTLKKKSRLE